MSILIQNTTAYVGPRFLRQDNLDLLIDGDRIALMGHNLSPTGHELLDGKDFFVTPGLINCHFHPSQQINRGLAVNVDHAKQMDILHATDRIRDAESKTILAQIAMLEGLKAGTTAFYAVGSDIEAQARSFKELGIRAACSMIPKDIEANHKPKELRAKTWQTEDRLNLAEKLFEQFHSDLVRIHFGACNVRYASGALILGMVKLAEKHNVGYHMHVAEGNEYVNEVIKRTGERSVEHLHSIGALSPRVSLAHATKINDAEIGFLAKTGATIVHCPRANAYNAVGNCPVSKLLDAKVNVALGSDAAINNNSNEVRGEARVAFHNMSVLYERADIISFQTLFAMLTLNGARALCMENELGMIAEGQKADLVLWNKNDLPFIPGHNYLADLIFTESGSAHTILINGKKVLQNYRSTMVDEDALKIKARQASERHRTLFEQEVQKHIATK
jgi:5-methylthioadenosine/S-adenosylhomocysteine deaminase